MTIPLALMQTIKSLETRLATLERRRHYPSEFDTLPADVAAAQTSANQALTENDVQDVDIANLWTAIRVQQAQWMLAGGGTLSWSTTQHLKWTARILPAPVDKRLLSLGYLGLDMPAVGTVIAGAGTTPSVTVSASGIALPSWTMLVAELSGSPPYSSYVYKVVNHQHISAGDWKSTWIVIAANNDLDGGNYLVTGMGQILKPGTRLIYGVPEGTRYIPLATPVTVMPVAQYDIGTRTINLASFPAFVEPASIKAVNARLGARWAAANAGAYIGLGNAVDTHQLYFRATTATTWLNSNGVANTDGAGVLKVEVGGANTLEATVICYGYYQ